MTVGPTAATPPSTSVLDVVRDRLRSAFFLPASEPYPERYIFLLLSLLLMVKIAHILLQRRRELLMNNSTLHPDVERDDYYVDDLPPAYEDERARIIDIPGAAEFLNDGRLSRSSFVAAASAFSAFGPPPLSLSTCDVEKSESYTLLPSHPSLQPQSVSSHLQSPTQLNPCPH